MNEQEKKAITEMMDAAADLAKADFDTLKAKYPEAFSDLQDWSRKHKPSSGVKRIGRIVLGEDWRRNA